MKNLLKGSLTSALLFCTVLFCGAQSINSSTLEASSITVKNFPDSEIIFKALESGKASYNTALPGKSKWDDVRERMLIPLVEGAHPKGHKSDNPDHYFKYAEVNMVRFNNDYEGKRVEFYIPGELFETGIAKFILDISYDDFNKIADKKYNFKVDF